MGGASERAEACAGPVVAACSGVQLPVVFASASAPGLSWGAVVGRRSAKKVGMTHFKLEVMILCQGVSKILTANRI